MGRKYTEKFMIYKTIFVFFYILKWLDSFIFLNKM